MTTATERRIPININAPKHILTMLEKESENEGIGVAPLLRKMIKWHAGLARGRHPASPKVKFPTKHSTKKKTKSVLLDPQDIEYLDSLSDKTGFNRTSVLFLVIFSWLDINPVSPKTA